MLDGYLNLCYLGPLFEDDEGMKGNIRAKGKCPSCGEDFISLKRLGFICKPCQTLPRRFYIDLWWDGKRIRLFSDKQGQVLDSYQRSQDLLSHIRFEITHHEFNPSKYIKSEAREYWAITLLDRFLAYKIDSLAPSYQKDYVRMTSIAKNFFGTKDVREIRKIDIINFKTHLEKNFSYKNKTIKNTLDFLKTFLRYLKSDLEVIDTVPAFPLVEIQQPRFRWLSPEDQRQLFEYIPDKDKPIIAFLMLHGCRPGEARALRCRDIDFKNQSITISATFSGKFYREKRKGKSSKAITIPLHPEIYEYIANRVENNLPEAFVFVNPRTGGYYTEAALQRLWDNTRRKAGISKDLRLYEATRHSVASQLVNNGVTLFKVSKLLGHSSIKTTEKYAHSNIESLRTELSILSLKGKGTVTRLSPEAKSRGKILEKSNS